MSAGLVAENDRLIVETLAVYALSANGPALPLPRAELTAYAWLA